MGLPKNRVTIPHTAGASEQFVLAGSGQRAPLPGYHRMSTGEHMRNDDQTGGGGMFFQPGATTTATRDPHVCPVPSAGAHRYQYQYARST